jgi:hypothetical protein
MNHISTPDENETAVVVNEDEQMKVPGSSTGRSELLVPNISQAVWAHEHVYYDWMDRHGPFPEVHVG